MDAVTYPNQEVIDHVEQNSIPVRIPFDSPLAAEFVVKWTPNLLCVDVQKRIHHRVIGFLPPEEVIPAVSVGIGKTFMGNSDLGRALHVLDQVLTTHSQSHAAPEALYFSGVCRYKQTHDGGPLKEVYEKLKDNYPNSEWAQRALPYRLL